jgi:hypothetical protein
MLRCAPEGAAAPREALGGFKGHTPETPAQKCFEIPIRPPPGYIVLWHEAVGCDTMAVAQLRYREGARCPVSVALLTS